MTERRKFSAKFKAMVAMEAIKEQQSIAEPAKKYEVHPSRIYQWKQKTVENMEKLFGGTYIWFMKCIINKLFVLTIGIARAKSAIGMNNLIYNMFRYKQIVRLNLFQP